MKRPLTPWLLASAVLAAGWVAACAEKPAPRFPHRVHLVELACGTPGKPACLTCNTCHAPSRPEREYKLPPASLCQTCHRENTETLASLYVVPPRSHGEIAIDHDKHLAMSAIGGQSLGNGFTKTCSAAGNERHFMI